MLLTNPCPIWPSPNLGPNEGETWMGNSCADCNLWVTRAWVVGHSAARGRTQDDENDEDDEDEVFGKCPQGIPSFQSTPEWLWQWDYGGLWDQVRPKRKGVSCAPDPLKFPRSFSSHGEVIEIGKRRRWREREERKEKKSKKEKKQAKAYKQKAAQASTLQRPRHTAEDDALTIHRSQLKKVQMDDRRIDYRKIDDYRIKRQSDLAISAPSEPARLLQRTTNLEQDVDELRDENNHIIDSMA